MVSDEEGRKTVIGKKLRKNNVIIKSFINFARKYEALTSPNHHFESNETLASVN